MLEIVTTSSSPITRPIVRLKLDLTPHYLTTSKSSIASATSTRDPPNVNSPHLVTSDWFLMNLQRPLFSLDGKKNASAPNLPVAEVFVREDGSLLDKAFVSRARGDEITCCATIP